ncbi:Major facilitator superfamily MFS_1 [Sphingobium herbicidovorans NBRC 16415]|uniref:Major facilitator superfamily MFS_1 n=1 Tax=Sphingobium herbicidovorans (strain ATCC 700291 / DSM 11019 / CCUG 56400 / KCTC 2939 / LMG 18315 / NBRC 16415 / MH) TaxID=1219045 RepID=A0A086PBX1_SPHHM|nr:MFS transporter [Sphingobium herbicidovorans]KFG90889.1 Major facilitator superfamily MFS_1 [Sphingobium herbicidovorans NBRC 16415]
MANQGHEDVRNSSPPEWREGWKVVLASTIGYGCCMPLFGVSTGLFIEPFQREFGWTVSQAAFAPNTTMIVALLTPFAGGIIDRVGARRVAIFGALFFMLFYLAMSILPMTLATIYLVTIVVGLLGASGGPTAFLRGVASWFDRHTATAFGITSSGTSIAGLVALPLVGAAIQYWGWRAGFLVMAAIAAFVMLPLILAFFREKPNVTPSDETREVVSEPAASLKGVLSDPRFWWLMLFVSSASLAMGVYLYHMQPILRQVGLTALGAAALGTVYVVAIGVGRASAGLLIDRFSPYAVTFVMIGVGAVGAFLLLHLQLEDYWLLVACVAAIGLTYGAEVDFGAYFSLRLFGLTNFGKVFGITMMVTGVSTSLGGMGASQLVDRFGSYILAVQLSAGLFALSAATILMLRLADLRRTTQP